MPLPLVRSYSRKPTAAARLRGCAANSERDANGLFDNGVSVERDHNPATGPEHPVEIMQFRMNVHDYLA